MSLLSKLFRSPSPAKPENLELWNRAEVALERVRPMMQADGGDIELVDAGEDSITVRLIGACSHCQSSTITMRDGVERVLREAIPGLKNITVE